MEQTLEDELREICIACWHHEISADEAVELIDAALWGPDGLYGNDERYAIVAKLQPLKQND